MSGVANRQQEAKAAWTSSYPFDSANGGLGVRLACTTSSGTSSRTALVGTGNVMIFTNVGDVVAYVAWGDSSIVATTSYFPVMPGDQLPPVTIPDDGSVTHVAGITESGSADLLVHRGWGN